MNLRLQSFLTLVSFLSLAACAPAESYQSVFDRTAQASSESDPLVDPIDQDQKETIADDENQDGEAPPTLFEKIMMNSDVSERALEKAFLYFDENHESIANQDWLTIFEIGRHSGEPRLFVINMKTGDVLSTYAAHGQNSDTNHDGIATAFSNVSGSKQSSLGFMLTAETYSGKYGYSLRMDGLEDRNDLVRSRAIVMHGADYVSEDREIMGRSWGCPAVSWEVRTWIIDRINGGSLFYAFHPDYD